MLASVMAPPIAKSILRPEIKPRIRHTRSFVDVCSMSALDRDSPDESPTGINVRVFPALLQDRREVLTATSTSGNPKAGRGSDLAIFPGIWTHSFCSKAG